MATSYEAYAAYRKGEITRKEWGTILIAEMTNEKSPGRS